MLPQQPSDKEFEYSYRAGNLSTTKFNIVEKNKENIVAWLKYNNHHGERPTTIQLTTPDDEEGFPVYREQFSTRSCNCSLYAREINIAMGFIRAWLQSEWKDFVKESPSPLRHNTMKFLESNGGYAKEDLKDLNKLEQRLDKAKEILHSAYRDLNQLNDQSVADKISAFLNDDSGDI
jgi:hypothetical protein